MKRSIYFVLFVSSFLVSCTKEAIDNKLLLGGKWNWKSSLADNGTQMLPRDISVSDSNYVIFSVDKFANYAGCVIGGQSEGSFELKAISGRQLLILKSPNARPDTFYVKVTNSQLDLTEVNSNCSWTHTFIKASL